MFNLGHENRHIPLSDNNLSKMISKQESQKPKTDPTKTDATHGMEELPNELQNTN